MIVVPATSRSATTLVGHFELLVLAFILHLLIGGLGSASSSGNGNGTLGRTPSPSTEPCMRGREMSGWPLRGSTDDRGGGRGAHRSERRPGARTCVAKLALGRNRRGPS